MKKTTVFGMSRARLVVRAIIWAVIATVTVGALAAAIIIPVAPILILWWVFVA
jgi:hypothetical protein